MKEIMELTLIVGAIAATVYLTIPLIWYITQEIFNCRKIFKILTVLYDWLDRFIYGWYWIIFAVVMTISIIYEAMEP
ncbi:MAG: hypothetical protein IJT73_03625 [Selenomonadaceae bacterium]|nr:hypothetical protein [Selenomonadaceae bacterium]